VFCFVSHDEYASTPPSHYVIHCRAARLIRLSLPCTSQESQAERTTESFSISSACLRLRLTVHITHATQDYDCFYASVFEHENPALKSLPLVRIYEPLPLISHQCAQRLHVQQAVQQVSRLPASHCPRNMSRNSKTFPRNRSSSLATMRQGVADCGKCS